MADGVVEVELGGEIPFAVVGVLTSDIVGVEGDESLGWRHTRRAGVELDHEMIVHVPHRVPLETEFVRQVDEDVLDLLLAQRDLTVARPCGVRFTQTRIRPTCHGREITVRWRRRTRGATIAARGESGRWIHQGFGRRGVATTARTVGTGDIQLGPAVDVIHPPSSWEPDPPRKNSRETRV